MRTEEFFIVRDNKETLLFGAQKGSAFIHMLYVLYDMDKTLDENIEYAIKKYDKRKHCQVQKYEVIC